MLQISAQIIEAVTRGNIIHFRHLCQNVPVCHSFGFHEFFIFEQIFIILIQTYNPGFDLFFASDTLSAFTDAKLRYKTGYVP